MTTSTWITLMYNQCKYLSPVLCNTQSQTSVVVVCYWVQHRNVTMLILFLFFSQWGGLSGPVHIRGMTWTAHQRQATFMPEANQAASQGTTTPEDNEVAPQAMLEANGAWWLWWGRHCPNEEVALAYCTGDFIMFGPCWLLGPHQSTDILPGGTGPPWNLSRHVRNHPLTKRFCQVNIDSSAGLESSAPAHTITSYTTSHDHKHLNHIYV